MVLTQLPDYVIEWIFQNDYAKFIATGIVLTSMWKFLAGLSKDSQDRISRASFFDLFFRN